MAQESLNVRDLGFPNPKSVYSWFAHQENQYSNVALLSINSVAIKIADVSGALRVEILTT